MDYNKIWGKDTREAIKNIDNRIDNLEKIMTTNHQETKELVNDTNLNFMSNEKNIRESVLNYLEKLNKRLDTLEKTISEILINQVNHV